MDLGFFARKYIWWQTPDSALSSPQRIIAQVMNLGTFEDVMALRALAGDDEFKHVLRNARPGEFSERSWHYWHLILGIAPLDDIPPMPIRRYA